MMFFSEHLEAAQELLDIYRVRGLRLAVAESCTGGLMGALLTEIPGSSDVFDGGFITYSNELKIDLLGVSQDLISAFGAVSDEAACAMAQGVIARTDVDFAVGITGIAGPGGGSEEKPLGLVYVAVAGRNSVMCKKNIFYGNRGQIRVSAVRKAIAMLQEVL